MDGRYVPPARPVVGVLTKSRAALLVALAVPALIMSCTGTDDSSNTRSHASHPSSSGQRATSPTRSPTAAPDQGSGKVSAAWVAEAIQRVTAGSPRFGVRDSAGAPMQTLKILPSSAFGYIGVYHWVTRGRFDVRVATSTNLQAWDFRAVLDTDASQAALARAPNGGYVLAVEADNASGPGPGRRFLRFRYYANAAALLSAHAARTFSAPHTLTAPLRGAEGTPNIYSVRTSPGITHSQIIVGFHYLSGRVDREARGDLIDFRHWTTRRDAAFDGALSAIGMHGKHGDRDAIVTTSGLVDLVECQTGTDPLWHLALYNTVRHRARLLVLRTPGGSRSFANPTITYARLPGGELGVIITVFVPQTGAAPGESGELVYSVSIASHAASTQSAGGSP
jgi:hypothetical protein